MLCENEKRLIEENMNKIEIAVKMLMTKYNINRDEFEDYRQTGYLILCEKVGKYDGSVMFSTFAKKVLANAFIDKYRREKAKNPNTVSLNELVGDDESEVSLADFLAADNNTENEVLTKVTGDMLKNCIKNAKSKCTANTTVKGFEALELKIEGYSGEEIAAMFNVPSNSLRSWISRAKKILLSENDVLALIR